MSAVTSPEPLQGLRDAARRHPTGVPERTAYAAALVAAARHAEAHDELLDAIAHCGESVALAWRLAFTEAALGRGAEAYETLRRALAVPPSLAEDWRGIGALLLQLQRWDEAQPALREAARLAPGDPVTLAWLATAEHATSEDEAALAHRAQVRRMRPDSLAAALAHALHLPLIPTSDAALQAARVRYTQGLAEVRGDLPRWRRDPAQVFTLGQENFLLAYHGEDDLALQRDYSSLLATLAGDAHPEWREPRALRWDGQRRLRIGFASAGFYECTAGRYFERWLTGLDPARFERFAYHLAAFSDGFTAKLAAATEHFAAAPSNPEALAARIAADALDILVYPEVGMTPALYLLAALRLAPIQLAGWGHPVTTGSDAIDGYFTSAAMEPPGAEQHYVERLLPLPGLGVQYAMPRPVAPFARGELGVAPGAALYACPQSLFKIHPAMDDRFAELLQRDPDAVLLFFQGMSRGSTQRFGERLQRAFAARGLAPRGQVKFLPRMPGDAFRRVLATCDLVLDTIGWSGGNTTLDTLSAGTPVVTLPGRFMRGRQSAAMLRMIGLESLVVESPAAWVETAHAVAHDRAGNAALREAILARRAALFDRPEPFERYQETLLQLAHGAAG